MAQKYNYEIDPALEMKMIEAGMPQEIIALRKEYVSEVVTTTTKTVDTMRAKGVSVEKIAIKVHKLRREIGVKYKDATPADLRNYIYERNIKEYGDPLGPTIKWLQKEGKTWEQIITGACKPGEEGFLKIWNNFYNSDKRIL